MFFSEFFGQILDILDKVGKIWPTMAGENNILDAAAMNHKARVSRLNPS